MLRLLATVFFTSFLTVSFALAESSPSVVLPEGRTLDDHRLQPPKDLDGFFPFDVPDSKDAWEDRAEELTKRVLVSTNLWPMPEKTPLNAVIHGKVERDGFTVEKVYFESVPGFYVTGILFRPKGQEGPFPAVLTPHGHGGRMQDAGEDRIKTQIEKGEEKHASSGRMPKIARGAQLARMGCVTFLYDMIGYTDSVQLSYELAHRFAKQRPELDKKDRWGFFSTQAELRLQSIMGLQTWNSIRALDFLCSLPDVDTSRIGVTGGSGGGTQTILLCAIDSRPIVAFPQGMVSTAMQGGCTCENCSLLRIGTGNVELAGLFAPKPQAMTAANDWTKDMMTVGYPELRELYGLYDARENVDCKPYLHFPHNYNYVTRADMYHWFNEHLDLGLQEPIVENDFPLLTREEQSVWNDNHPTPEEQGEEFEVKLLQQMDRSSRQQIQALAASIPDEGLAKYREVIGGAVEVLIGRTSDDVGSIEREKVSKIDNGNYWLFHDIITATEHREQLPVVSLYPKERDWNGQVILWTSEQGKSTLFKKDGSLADEVAKLVDAGCSVVSADLFGQGEFNKGHDLPEMNRVVENPREYAGYTYTYNHALFAQRTHDLLTLVKWIQSSDKDVDSLTLVGVGKTAPLVLAAAAVSSEGIDQLAVDTDKFRFTSLDSYRTPSFLPGIVKYGDVPALIALAMRPDREVLVLNDRKKIPSTVKAIKNAVSTDAVKWESEQKGASAAVEWILNQD